MFWDHTSHKVNSCWNLEGSLLEVGLSICNLDSFAKSSFVVGGDYSSE